MTAHAIPTDTLPSPLDAEAARAGAVALTLTLRQLWLRTEPTDFPAANIPRGREQTSCHGGQPRLGKSG